MFFSFNKLKSLANLDSTVKVEDVVYAINNIGFEVEDYYHLNTNNLKNIKFGKIIKTRPNPNSNKLTICDIEFNDKIRQIQTRAKNMKEGDFIISFIEGSTFKDIVIEPKMMANEISQGMLMSLEELGFDKNLINNNEEEILILPKQNLNDDPLEVLGINDYIIEISFLPNRSDAQCYLIMALEIAAYFKKEKNKINLDFDKLILEFKKIKNKDNNFCVENTTKENINSLLLNISEKSSLTIFEIILLLKSKIKIENSNILNILNYIKILTTIPFFSLDFDKLKSNNNNFNFKVENTSKDFQGENLTLTSKETLTYLLLNETPLILLGVDVNKNFKLDKESKNALIYFNYNDPKINRDNFKKAKIINSNYTYTCKNISFGNVLISFNFLKSFFAFNNIFNDLKIEKQKVIDFDLNYLESYTFKNITKEKYFKNVLIAAKILYFKYNKQKKEIIIPYYRNDIFTMQDIVEEICRFYGLNNFNLIKPQLNEEDILLKDQNSEEEIIDKLTFLGYTKVNTYTLVSKEEIDFNPFNFKNQFKLKTFTSNEYSYIRNSIALPLLKIYDYNKKRNITNLSFFDFGLINDQKALIFGTNSKSFLEIKKDLAKLLNSSSFEIRKLNSNYLHPSFNAQIILNNEQIGWIGKISPKLYKNDFIMCEILFKYLENNQKRNSFYEYDTNPLKERDITFTLNLNDDVQPKINKLKEEFKLFDLIFLGEYIHDGKISYTYKIFINEKEAIDFDQKYNKK